ncbi:LOW QUALITY PROTEIN: putative N-acetyltransferase 16 [Glossophaga mutica]
MGGGWRSEKGGDVRGDLSEGPAGRPRRAESAPDPSRVSSSSLGSPPLGAARPAEPGVTAGATRSARAPGAGCRSPRAEPVPSDSECGPEARSGSGFETEDKPLGAESGLKAKAKFLGAKPRSGSGPGTEVEWLDFVGATEREFEEVLAISGGYYGGLNYLPNPYHSWLRDPTCTMVLAKWNRGVIALESVHLIDTETVLVEGLRVAPERGKGVTKLLQRFCLQLVKRQYLGVKVAQLAQEEPLPWGLKKYHLIKQGVLLVSFNAPTLLAGLGTRQALLRVSGTFSPLPTEALSEAGGDTANLPLSSPFMQRDVLPGRTWQALRPRGLEALRPRAACACWWPRTWSGARTAANAEPVSVASAAPDPAPHRLQRLVSALPGAPIVVTASLVLPAGLGLELVKDYAEQYLLEADI